MALARYDYLVIADSDVRVTRDYLARVVAPLLDPSVGIITCCYRGWHLPGSGPCSDPCSSHHYAFEKIDAFNPRCFSVFAALERWKKDFNQCVSQFWP